VTRATRLWRSLVLALTLLAAAPAALAAELRIEWKGGGTDKRPGTWTIRLFGPGAAGGTYAVDGGPPVSFEPGDTTVPVPAMPGAHTISIRGPGGLALQDTRRTVDDDPTPPALTIEYAGRGTRLVPGVWMIDISDPESPGPSGAYRIGDGPWISLPAGSSVVAVPYYEGTYTITVTATNNDRDFPGDEDTVTVTDTRPVR
jgi:hypothetical protein